MTVEPAPSWSSSSAPTTSVPSRSSTTTSATSDNTQWLSLAVLFSDSSWEGSTLSSSLNGTTANFLIESGQLASVHERGGGPGPRLHPSPSAGALAPTERSTCFSQITSTTVRCRRPRASAWEPTQITPVGARSSTSVWSTHREQREARVWAGAPKGSGAGSGGTGGGKTVKMPSLPVRSSRSLSAASRYRQRAADAAGHQQAPNPAPWRHSKVLIGQIRLRRQALGRTASL